MRFILITALFFSAQAFAVEDKPAMELSAGSSLTYFKYQELCTPSDSEGGQFNSLVADAKIHFLENSTNLEFRYETGKVNSNYNGAYLNNNQPVTSTDPLTFTDYETDLNIGLSDDVYFYVGYGHHVWNRFLASGSSYREIYSWDYFPVGVQARFLKSESVDIGLDLSLKPTANGKIRVITSETIPGGQDSDAILGAKTGFKAKIPIRWHFDRFSITTSPWFEHLEIGQSNTFTNTTLISGSGQGDEPNSETYIYGLEVMLGIAF
jgi:hypothetical protein